MRSIENSSPLQNACTIDSRGRVAQEERELVGVVRAVDVARREARAAP